MLRISLFLYIQNILCTIILYGVTMTIKRSLEFFYLSISISLGALLWMVFLIIHNQQGLDERQYMRYASYLLADELRQSSDDLTRLARTYVVTGNPVYKTMYFDILDIRNGKKPRPERYEGIYWDFVAARGTKPRPDGETVALEELMKRLGFTEQEFAKLREAKANSDALVGAETRAMNAVEGLFQDDQGNFTITKEPDLELARLLTHDKTYHEEKAKIMGPIDEFLVLLDKRTATEVEIYREEGQSYLYIISALIICQFIGLSFLYLRVAKRKILKPLLQLDTATNQIASGNSSVTLDISSQDEIGNLSNSFNSMVDQLRSVENERTEYLQKNVGIVISAMEKFSNGDLTVQIPIERTDEIGKLQQSFNRAVSNIRTIIQQINDAMENTATAVTEINKEAAQLTATANTQSQHVMGTVSAIEQMTQTIHSNASSTSQAAQTASGSEKFAQEGGAVMQRTLAKIRQIAELVNSSAETVESLGKRGSEIGAITSVINEIADQTNLLALNAAIEAARAGEQGRGFAVVADEVRKLAERTAKATKQIEQMIREMQEETNRSVTMIQRGQIEAHEGMELADKAGFALTQIVNSVREVQASINQIAAASEEQSTTSSEITQSMLMMAKTVEQSSSGIESIAHMSTGVKNQAFDLQKHIQVFRL